MALCRIAHNRQNPYVLLNSGVLRDKNLSFKAKGLWAYCLSFTDNWTFHISKIEEHTKEGKKAIYSAIDELIENDYCIRIDYYEKSEDNKFSGGCVEYVFFEFKATPEEKQPFIDNLKKCSRESRFGDLRGGSLQKEPLVLPIEKEYQKREISTTTTLPPPRVESAQVRENGGGGGSLSSSFSGAEVKYLSPSGEEKSVSKSEIYSRHIKSPFATEIIERAIIEVSQSLDRIGNFWKYFEAICKRLQSEGENSITQKEPISTYEPPKPTTKYVNLGEEWAKMQKVKQNGN